MSVAANRIFPVVPYRAAKPRSVARQSESPMHRALFLDRGGLVNLDGSPGTVAAPEPVLDSVGAPLAWFAARYLNCAS
jgi:hypothetical protein